MCCACAYISAVVKEVVSDHNPRFIRSPAGCRHHLHAVRGPPPSSRFISATVWVPSFLPLHYCCPLPLPRVSPSLPFPCIFLVFLPPPFALLVFLPPPSVSQKLLHYVYDVPRSRLVYDVFVLTLAGGGRGDWYHWWSNNTCHNGLGIIKGSSHVGSRTKRVQTLAFSGFASRGSHATVGSRIVDPLTLKSSGKISSSGVTYTKPPDKELTYSGVTYSGPTDKELTYSGVTYSEWTHWQGTDVKWSLEQWSHINWDIHRRPSLSYAELAYSLHS